MKNNRFLVTIILLFCILFLSGIQEVKAGIYIYLSPTTTKLPADTADFKKILEDVTGCKIKFEPTGHQRKFKLEWKGTCNPSTVAATFINEVIQSPVTIALGIGQNQTFTYSRRDTIQGVLIGQWLQLKNANVSVGTQIIDMSDLRKYSTKTGTQQKVCTQGAVLIHEIMEVYYSLLNSWDFKKSHNWAVWSENCVLQSQGIEYHREFPVDFTREFHSKIERHKLPNNKIQRLQYMYERLKKVTGWNSTKIENNKNVPNPNTGYNFDGYEVMEAGYEPDVTDTSSFTKVFKIEYTKNIPGFVDFTYNDMNDAFFKVENLSHHVNGMKYSPNKKVLEIEAFPIPFNMFSRSDGDSQAVLKVVDMKVETGGDVVTKLELHKNSRTLKMPGFDDFSIHIGSEPPDKSTQFSINYYFPAYFELGTSDPFEGEIRLPRKILTPAKSEKDTAKVKFDKNSTLSFDLDSGDFMLGGLSLAEAEIAGTGITLKITDMGLDLSKSENLWNDAPEGLDKMSNSWEGFYIEEAEVTLPDIITDKADKPFVISAKHLAIDNQGVTGRFSADLSKLSDIKFSGFEGTLKKCTIGFVHNTFDVVDILARIKLPYAASDSFEVQFSIDVDGNWSASVKNENEKELLTLVLPDTSATSKIKLSLEKLRFGVEDDKGFVDVDGDLGVEFANLPAFKDLGIEFTGLQMTSGGDFKLPDGGWLNLDSFKEADLYAFKFRCRKIGFGEESGKRWFGIGGNFKLPDAFGIGVTLNEIKFKWDKSGSGLSLEVPKIDIVVDKKDIMKLEGSLEFQNEDNDQKFAGDIEATFPALDFSVGAELIIGNKELPNKSNTKKEKTQFWYFKANTQFPTGIVIASNVSIYGFMGGAGENVKTEIDTASSGAIEKIDIGPIGYLEEKGFLFQVGLTVGTSSDNGYVINADLGLIVETSGPVITLEGRGWLMQERFKRKESNVYAIIRYDGNNDMFLMQMTGHYEIKAEEMTIVKIGGGFEVLAAPAEWHVYLGWRECNCLTPKPEVSRTENKLQVEVIKYFRANGYFMIGSKLPFPIAKNNHCPPAIMVGAGFKYGGEFDAKIVKIYCNFWGSGDLGVSWEPVQTYVTFGLGGRVGFTVFGIDFGKGFDAGLHGQYPNPAVLKAHVSFSLPFPWPLPDIRISFSLAWNDDESENPNINNPYPAFKHPLKSCELVFPQRNLPPGKKGLKLVCSGPSSEYVKTTSTIDDTLPPCRSGQCFIPSQQDTIERLNPRFVLTFNRPITGNSGSQFQLKDINQDVYPLGGWQSGKAEEFVDQVGQFEAWYRFRDAALYEIEPGPETFSCVSLQGTEIAGLKKKTIGCVGHWGSEWDPNPVTAWYEEKKALIDDPTPIGGRTDTSSYKLIDERRRQIFKWYVVHPYYETLGATSIVKNETSIIEYPPTFLAPETNYQMKIIGRYDWNWPFASQGQHSSGGSGGKKDALGSVAENYYFCFKTGPVPYDLTPYVAWTNPEYDAANVFYGEDLIVLFNTAGVPIAFKGLKPKIAIYDRNNKELLGGYFLELNDQMMVLDKKVLLERGIAPRKRYFIKILNPLSYQPLFTLQFTTSQYQSFNEMMKKSTVYDHKKVPSSTVKLPISKPSTDYITLSTPEPLPWKSGKVNVNLMHKGTSIPVKRITPDSETIHVFVRKDGKNLQIGHYEMHIEYSSKLPGKNLKELRSRIPSLLYVKDADIKPEFYPPKDIVKLSFTRSS